MAKFDSEFLPVMFPLPRDRFKTKSGEEFARSDGPFLLEQYCSLTTDGKWIMGTDELTLADVHMGAMFDVLFAYHKTEPFVDCFDQIDLGRNAPVWLAYM